MTLATDSGLQASRADFVELLPHRLETNFGLDYHLTAIFSHNVSDLGIIFSNN